MFQNRRHDRGMDPTAATPQQLISSRQASNEHSLLTPDTPGRGSGDNRTCWPRSWHCPAGAALETHSLAGDDATRRLPDMTPGDPLTPAQAIERLMASEGEIRALGVQRLALFGSVLRGEARPDSDVDLLVQFAPGKKTYERFLALCDLLEAVLGRRVELVTAEALSPFLGPRILAEARDVLRAA